MDDNFVLSPAALWSCLIVFLADPPPENFEQLTSGKTFIGQMALLSSSLLHIFSLKQNSLPFTLLNFSRKEVVRYAQSRGLSLWCESKCNEEITLRNLKSLINNNYI